MEKIKSQTIQNAIDLSKTIVFEYDVKEDGISFSENEAAIISDIKNLDVTKITPLEAMNILFDYHNKVKE